MMRTVRVWWTHPVVAEVVNAFARGLPVMLLIALLSA
jgi:hypothetical protein